MHNSPILDSEKLTMEKAIEHLKKELSTIRTGRASTNLIEHLQVESYGSMMPLKSVASISIPESNQLLIQPWDKHVLGAIEKAIHDSGQSLNPVNDGSVIRIILAAPSEEKRKELVKVVHKKAEEGRIAIRNARQNAHSKLKQSKEAGQITEDDVFLLDKELQRLVDQFNTTIEELAKAKESEVMTL